MKLVDVVLEGTDFNVVNVKRSPVTKKLLVHIDDKHSDDLSILCPNKVISITFSNRIFKDRINTLLLKDSVSYYWFVTSIQEKLLAIDTQDRIRGIIVTVKGKLDSNGIIFNNCLWLDFQRIERKLY